MQTRLMSAVETVVSTVIGYSIATAANYYILPLFGYHISLKDASYVGFIMTVISIIRGYFIRRLFNWLWLRHFQKLFGVSATGMKTGTDIVNAMRAKGLR